MGGGGFIHKNIATCPSGGCSMLFERGVDGTIRYRMEKVCPEYPHYNQK